MDCQEYKEIIAAHVDGVLSSVERLAVQTHLQQCSPCMRKFLWETEVKKALKGKLTAIPARPGLKGRILDQLGETGKEGFLGRFAVRHGLAAAFAILLVVAVPYLLRRDKVQEDVFTEAITQYHKVTQGVVDAPEATSSLSPAARLLDLSPWGYRVLTKQTVRVRGQEGRVFIYQGEREEYLLAQEFDGVDFSFPSGAEVIRASSREFATYSQEGVNLIAFKEKGLLCILSATLPKEQLLGLAQQIVMAN